MTFVFYFIGLWFKLTWLAIGAAYSAILALPNIGAFFAGAFGRFEHLVGSDIAVAVFDSVTFQLTTGVALFVLVGGFKKVWQFISRTS